MLQSSLAGPSEIVLVLETQKADFYLCRLEIHSPTICWRECLPVVVVLMDQRQVLADAGSLELLRKGRILLGCFECRSTRYQPMQCLLLLLHFLDIFLQTCLKNQSFRKVEAYNDSKVTVLDGKEEHVTAVAKSHFHRPTHR